MAANWYKVWYGTIVPVEVVRATKDFVTVLENELAIGRVGKPPKTKKVERRYPKQGNGRSFFHTWAEAHAHLIQQLEADVRATQEALRHDEAKLEEARRLTMPTEQKDA
jgi:hypothetical protein